jgi:CRP-like cAMP-binding protein
VTDPKQQSFDVEDFLTSAGLGRSIVRLKAREMAEFGKPDEPETLIPRITQVTLAEMIGTTRSRVSFFMNRFRKLGFIEYNGRIKVHKSLLNVVLHDYVPSGFRSGCSGWIQT